MGRKEKEKEKESTLAEFAFHQNGASVQADKLEHQGKTYASTLVRAPARRLHAMESLAQQRQVLLRNADARVLHRQLRVRLCRVVGKPHIPHIPHTHIGLPESALVLIRM
jgi:hypothetical protein